jgi:micrococcal nuclease
MRVLGILFLSVVLSSLTFGQVRFAGKVVEVIDGRTVVIETSAGKVTAQLQYIETPAPEQQLHTVVRDHLASLAVGRVAEFRPLRLDGKVTVGKVEIGGVDLGLQLVRNGAAWQEPAETSGQPSNEAAEYASNQLSAKVEKRGVWSIPSLKTPWQIRAEKQAELDRIEKEKRGSRPATFAVNEFQTINRTGAADTSSWDASRRSDFDSWGDVFAGVGKETQGLQTYSDPQGRFDTIYTSASFVNMDGGKIDRRLECRLLLVYLKYPDGRKETVYALGFQSVADEYHFSKQKSSLTLTADKRNISVGPPFRGLRGGSAIGTREIFYYRLTKPQLRSIAAAKNLELRIDGMLGSVSADALPLFKELSATAN